MSTRLSDVPGFEARHCGDSLCLHPAGRTSDCGERIGLLDPSGTSALWEGPRRWRTGTWSVREEHLVLRQQRCASGGFLSRGGCPTEVVDVATYRRVGPATCGAPGPTSLLAP